MVRKINETEEQLNILDSEADIKRVIACAGSGKTWVITSSIIKIIANEACSPDRILALTFTRNAAENMRMRIKENIEREIDFESIDIFTFNSFGNEIITKNSFELGLGKDFKIISSSQSWQILYEIFKELDLKYLKAGKKIGQFIQYLLNYIENLKNNLISGSEFEEYISNYKKILAGYKSKALRAEEEELIENQKELFDIYLRYEKKKTIGNCIDYSDQVFMPYFLLLEKKSIRTRYQQKYKYIFVDEFQDTNISQAYMLSLLSSPGHNRLMIVGDDDQGIYSFRGACVENILNFHNFDKFKNCYVSDFYLTTNFRSGTNIIDTVNNIISSNKGRFKKELKPEDSRKDSEVVFYSKKTHEGEAVEICRIIKYLAARGIKFKEIAILARRKRFEKIAEELKSNGIKFELVGGKNFFFEPEILFIISWLRVINDINDEISIIYLLKSKKYKICDRDIYFIKKKWKNSENRISITEGIIDFKKNPYISKTAKERLKDFLNSLKFYISKSRELELKELISLIIEDSGIMNELKSEFGPVAGKKIKNIENLIRIASDFEQSYIEGNLEGFMTYLKDVAKTDYEDPETMELSNENSVKVMSIHAAKGLEFEVVFLPMLWKNDYLGKTSEKGFTVPSELRKDGRIWKEKKNFKSTGDFKQALKNIKLEEERRIFYVACSRAKKILVLSYSEYEDNIAAGSEKIKAKEIAPFFNDIIDKDNRLRIINQEGLDFINLNYKKEPYNGYENYKDVFDFLKPVKKRKKDILIFNEKEWRSSQEALIDRILEVSDVSRENNKILKTVSEMNSRLPAYTDIKDMELSSGFFPLTQILDYIRCPLLYKWRYIYLIPEKISKELTVGEKIHKYIENITLIGFNNNEITKDMIIKKFKDNRIKKYIRIFLDSSFWGFSGIRSIMLEQLFYWKVNDYFVVGKLDRVDINKDSKIRVVDYKVSGYLKGKNNSGQSQPEDSHCLQLKVYIGALSDIYKKPLEDITGFLFYLKDGVEVSLCPDYGQIEKSKQIILDAIDNITKGNFGSKFKKTCEKKCGYVKFCSRY